MSRSQEILDFWFGTDEQQPLKNVKMWWTKDPELDLQIKISFEDDLAAAASGQLDSWKNAAKSCLAFIILTDQFSRNIYRDTQSMFFYDELALATSVSGQEQGFADQLNMVERWFFYMPMMHSESLIMQQRSVETYRRLSDESAELPEIHQALESAYEFAVRHFEIIESYGRFPHRNKILGRETTPAEEEFLSQPGSSF